MKNLLTAIAATCMLMVTAASAAEVPAPLKKIFPGISEEDVRPSAIDGILEVVASGEVVYVTSDGRYLIQGDMVDLASGKSLTEARRGEARTALLASFDDSNSILFAPEGKTKHTVTVFTDIDCGYCRKMHREIADYNAEGIAIRYLFYPRAGLKSGSYKKAEAVWCSADRQAAMTRSKSGQTVDAASCANPIADHYNAGRVMGLRGTPMMLLEDGTKVGGYLPAKALAARIP